MADEHWRPSDPQPTTPSHVDERYRQGSGYSGMGSSERPGQHQGGGMQREMQGEAREMADRAMHEGREYAERGRQYAEQGRERAAEGADRAATMLRERGPQEGRAGEMTDRAAQGVEQAAGYLRGHDTNQMMQDLEMYVREHPMQALAGAIGAGFLIGRMLR